MAKSSRKSQAALEFLTTYAWAFLIIIIMIGALAYFGVLSPSKLLPDRCNFGSEVACNKDLLVATNINGDGAVGGVDDAVIMRLRNGAGSQLSVTGFTVTTDVANLGTCTGLMQDVAGIETLPSVGTPTTWGADETRTFVVECTTGINLVKKEKIKFNLELNYFPTTSGSSYGKKTFGEVYTTVQ